ncbi:MAG: alpha/beta hydrolase [Christensenellaceae bacterium]|jgi:acetyl esterase/lipase|nr:alpha/beta hydrolase [Christensenellaceae bacterium]
MNIKLLLPLVYCRVSDFLGGKLLFNKGASKNVSLEKKIKYGSEKVQFLEVHRPKNAEKPLPLMVYIHGGGFVSGSPCNRRALCANLADGLNCVVGAVYYGLSPKIKFHEQLENVYKAIAFLRENAAKYGADDGEIIITGDSAGAHIAGILAAIETLPEFRAKYYPEHEAQYKVKMLLDISGIFDATLAANSGFPAINAYLSATSELSYKELNDEEKTNFLSPARFVTADYPPTFLTIGDKDHFKEDELPFYATLQELGVKSGMYYGKGGASVHDFIVYQGFKISKEALQAIIDFYKTL